MTLRLRFALILLIACLISTGLRGDEIRDGSTHSITEQISEGLNLSGGVRGAVTEFFHFHGRFPVSNAEAGLLEPYEIKGKYAISVTVTAIRGIISVEFGGDAAQEIYGRTIEWTPTLAGSKLEWSCSSQYISDLFWPEVCQ